MDTSRNNQVHQSINRPFPYQIIIVNWPKAGVCKILPVSNLTKAKRIARKFVSEHIELTETIFLVECAKAVKQLLVVGWPYPNTYKILPFSSLEEVVKAVDDFASEHVSHVDKLFIINGGIVQIGFNLDNHDDH